VAERIKKRVPITSRPTQVDAHKVVGHWESNSIVGGDRHSGLNVIVERASRLVHISLMNEQNGQGKKVSYCPSVIQSSK